MAFDEAVAGRVRNALTRYKGVTEKKIALVVLWLCLFPLIFSNGSTKAFWAGFVVFGWSVNIVTLSIYELHYNALTAAQSTLVNIVDPSRSATSRRLTWEFLALTEMLLLALPGGFGCRYFYKKRQASDVTDAWLLGTAEASKDPTTLEQPNGLNGK